MKARDTVRVAVLRSAISALANAEAVEVADPSALPVAFGTSEVPRRDLDEAAERAVLAAELQEVRAAADELRRLERAPEAANLEARAAVLAPYLEPG
jgi:hypothetical protein